MLLKRHKRRMKMRVLYDGRLWSLDMSRLLFNRLLVENPNLLVTIDEMGESERWAERRRVRLYELKAQ